MKKLRKMISALALSASLLLTGCSGTLNPPMPGTGGQQETWGTQGTTRANEPAAPDTPRDVSQSNSTTPTMDVNGYAVTISDAVYCVTENGGMVMIAGEYSGVYVLLMLSSSTGFQANTSLSQKDFGSTKEVGAALVEPSSGLVIADNSQAGVTGASFSVKDISDSSMNVSISAALSESNLTFNISASGAVTLTDLDTCTKIISEFDELAASAQSTADSNRQPFTCTGCKGSRKCQYCYGEGSGVCGACLGLLDHCMSCGGTHVCKYCRGSGICHHCNGEGVMY